MARVAFFQKDVFAKPAVMALSASLKEAGHESFVVVADLEKNPVKAVLALNPDVVAFSITTAEFPFLKEMGSRLRALSDKIFIVCGGIHSTFYPQVISEPYLDAVCRGEADEAFPEFVNALGAGNAYENVQNFWVKKHGVIWKNDLKPLVKNLDSLPFYDRRIYPRYSLYAGKSKGILYHQVIHAGRGCPRSCSFCFNECYKSLYEGKGSPVRRRSVNHLIAELKALKSSGDIDFITIDDDSFTIAPSEWINHFCEVYPLEIGLPFKINTIPDALDETLVRRLKQAGCYAVKMGIESGNDAVRNVILKKNLRKESIIEAASLLKQYDIRFQTFNMVGCPRENLAMAFETYALNRRIRPDFVWCSLLTPYPGTAVFDLCKHEGLISGGDDYTKINYSYFTGTPLNLPHKQELINLQKLMNVAVRLNLPERVLRFLVKLPLSGLYNFIFGIGMTWGLIRINKDALLSIAWLSLRYFSRYNKNEKKGKVK